MARTYNVIMSGPPGPSAYEIWLLQGNTGSISDFFAAGLPALPARISVSVGIADAGKLPLLNGSGVLDSSFLSASVGNVLGPASSTNLNIPVFNGATGKLLLDSGVKFSTDGSLSSNSDSLSPSEKAVKTYVDSNVTGLLELKGFTDCSANPNYPAGIKGDVYIVSVTGKIGGVSGVPVEKGDWYVCTADNAGGTQAAVGGSWGVLQTNLINVATRNRVLGPAITSSALTASEVFFAVTPPVGETWTFPANFANASGKKLSGGTNPAASYVIDVKKNGSSTGTITISTGGAVTFATSGGSSFTLIGGTDELQLVGPGTVDTAVGYAFAIPLTY
jgi:hypothetical protein